MFDIWKKFTAPSSPEETPGTASTAGVAALFAGCADFTQRAVRVGRTRLTAQVCWLDGLVSSPEAAEDVLRPLSRLDARGTGWQVLNAIQAGGVYCPSVRRHRDDAALAQDLAQGCVAVIFDEAGTGLSFEARATAGRSVSAPSVEKTILGAKDAFVETLRVNTCLVRRHLRDPALKLWQGTVGRRSRTAVAVFSLAGVVREGLVDQVIARLEALDIDGVTALGDLEQYLADRPRGVFPQALHTERPDRFARSLLQGRVGILADGLPVGILLPGTLPEMLHVPEDRARHALVASGLVLLRWVSLFLSLALPALFVAVAMFHPEMIPYRLLQSIIRSKQEVPFGTAAEILGMLAAFELLQEAGIRLPDPVGQTVSIIGALIVGQSAVEARVISPIAVIVVALAGIAGYTQPSQELGAAIRLWRFLLALCSLALGLYGMMAGLMLLLWRLCDMESLGVAYMYPACDGERGSLLRVLFRPPLRLEKKPRRKGGRNP